LFVANDYKKKGLPVLLGALKKLPSNYFLTVVGNSAQVPQYFEAVNALGLQQRVFFLGSLDDVGDAYLSANCLAHPTLEDTFAMVVLEAMAYGLPVVVSGEKYCGISQLLTNKVNALVLSNPRDAAELAAAVSTFFEHNAASDALSCAALAFVREYLWTSIASKQARVYLSNGPAGNVT
jgi:UDP-glucose:(heptosyl)LPS alpha-1,3-glucosyltransferase